MNKIKHAFLILTVGLFATTLGGCKSKKGKDPLVIPTVDVASLSITLPDRPTYNQGDIRVDGDYEVIDLYELSDFHGAVSYESHSSGTYIGLAKLASFFEQKRQENAGGTLILSSGDMFQGSADSNLTRGYMVNYAMQYMGFDAMTLGNHEFDWTDEWIKNNANLQYGTSKIPYLGANITKDGALPDFLKKSTVIERGAYRIGVIGVIGNELENTILKSCVAGYEFSKYQTIVEQEAASLKASGCNAVVLLAHEGGKEIETVSGVEAIFGGHAHKDYVGKVNTIPTVATLNYGQSVGHIELKFDKTTKEFVTASSGETIPMSSVASSLQENANVKNIMDQYAPEIDKIKNIKLGTADAELRYDKAVKNLCVKAMFDAAISSANQVPEIDSSKIVCAFHNVEGGIRSNIDAGDVTYGKVYKAFPFDNEVVLVKVTGQEILSKIVNLNQLGVYRIFDKRDYFNANEEYYFALTDFIALSDDYFGGKFKTLTDDDLIRTGKVVRDEVARHIYELDNLVNADLTANVKEYRAIPNTF